MHIFPLQESSQNIEEFKWSVKIFVSVICMDSQTKLKSAMASQG